MARIRLDDPCYYFNRHESWMAFNRRVLEEAQDEGNPLLERVKFLAITASNLDEFVGSTHRRTSAAARTRQSSCRPRWTVSGGATPAPGSGNTFLCKQSVLSAGTRSLPALAREGIRILLVASLDRASKDAMDLFFTRRVDPILTPVTIDPSHPFPHVINRALCVAFQLRRQSKLGTTHSGVVTVPAKNWLDW